MTANPITQQRYLTLPGELFSECLPNSMGQAKLVKLNTGLLDSLGVDPQWFLQADAAEQLLNLPTQTKAQPCLALAYAGHQFGHWVPLLGDGRAHLLGQLECGNGKLVDVQLKGSGQTPYSRSGDGKASLSSALREYIISEAMAGLGIASTRSLAVLSTGETILRERPEPGGIVVRTAQSHIRVGSFQYAASINTSCTQALADFILEQHYPERLKSENRYCKLIEAVAEHQAKLVAEWMLVGFIHGVMNTDNMSVVGETIDFGPCAFLDEFNPNKVFSSIDHQGRYAWGNQGNIAYWNLTRFAETLLPLLAKDSDSAVRLAQQALTPYQTQFRQAFEDGLRKKLGLDNNAESRGLLEQTLPTLATHKIDFTLFFDRLSQHACGEDASVVLELFEQAGVAETGKQWLADWQTCYNGNSTTLRQANPALIARNHHVQAALNAVTQQNDWTLANQLCEALAQPYRVKDQHRYLSQPPREEERITQTFCGT